MTDTTVRTERGWALAADALVLVAVGAIGAGYCATRGWWIAAGIVVVLTVGAWFTLRACARKVSGWHDQQKGENDVDAN